MDPPTTPTIRTTSPTDTQEEGQEENGAAGAYLDVHTPVPKGQRKSTTPSILSGVSSFARSRKLSEGTQHNLQETTKISLVLLLPMLMLIGMTANALVAAVDSQRRATDTKIAVLNSLEVAELVRNLQIERGRTAMFTSDRSTMLFYRNMLNARLDTDDYMQVISDWSSVNFNLGGNLDKTKSAQSALTNYLGTLRNNVDIGVLNTDETIRAITAINKSLLDSLFNDVNAPENYRLLVAFDDFIRCGEAAGIMRAVGSGFWVTCSEKNRVWLLEMFSSHNNLLTGTFRYDKDMEGDFELEMEKIGRPWNYIENMTYFLTSESMRDLCLGKPLEWRQEMSFDWFDNCTDYINSLARLTKGILYRLSDGLSHQYKDAELQVIIYSCIMILVMICIIVTMTIVYKMTSKVQKFAADIASKTDQVAGEKKRTETLLYQMMPKDVADQLLAGTTVEPEYFDAVTIYFSDIVGFTSISARSSPAEVIDLLNAVYGTFDHILDKYDVYKVETIGDAYMVSSGLPKRNGNAHAAEIGLMSLQLLKVIPNIAVAHLPNETLKLRIGLHSGPCAAGIVGIKMPRYCLFGDTVNTASRMESTGEALKVHISESTQRIILKSPRASMFNTEVRGTVTVKGKGTMVTHWLTSSEEKA